MSNGRFPPRRRAQRMAVTTPSAAEREGATLLPTTRSRPRRPQQEYVCGGSIRPTTCYLLATTFLIPALVVMILVGQAAVNVNHRAVESKTTMETLNALLEPVAMHRDIVEAFLLRVGGVLDDPRFQALDLAEMAVGLSRIEGHVANVSAVADRASHAVAVLMDDPRLQRIDWAGHVANASLALEWVAQERIGEKLEVGVQELDELMARMLRVFNAMAALQGADPSSSS